MSHKYRSKRLKNRSIHRECVIVALGLLCTGVLWGQGSLRAALDHESVCVSLTVVGLDNGDPGSGDCVGFIPPASSSSSSSSSSASSAASSAASSVVSPGGGEEREGDGARRGTIERSTQRIRDLIREWEQLHRAPQGDMPFTDVPEGAWFEDAVRALWKRGLLDDAERLRPHDGATRAESAKLLVAMQGIVPGYFRRIHFNDVPRDSWFFGYIEEAARQGWMKGYDNCYGRDVCFTMPVAVITRAEAAALIVRVLGLPWMGDAPRFADNPNGPWYVRTIQIAADHCVLRGDDVTGMVRPNDRVTRAELLMMIHRALQARTYRDGCAGEGMPSVLPARRTLPPTLSFQDGLPSLEGSIAVPRKASPMSLGACVTQSFLPSSMVRCVAKQSVLYGHAMLATLRMPGGEFINNLHPSEPVAWAIAAIWVVIAGRLLFLMVLRFLHTPKRAPGH